MEALQQPEPESHYFTLSGQEYLQLRGSWKSFRCGIDPAPFPVRFRASITNGLGSAKWVTLHCTTGTASDPVWIPNGESRIIEVPAGTCEDLLTIQLYATALYEGFPISTLRCNAKLEFTESQRYVISSAEYSMGGGSWYPISPNHVFSVLTPPRLMRFLVEDKNPCGYDTWLEIHIIRPDGSGTGFSGYGELKVGGTARVQVVTWTGGSWPTVVHVAPAIQGYKMHAVVHFPWSPYKPNFPFYLSATAAPDPWYALYAPSYPPVIGPLPGIPPPSFVLDLVNYAIASALKASNLYCGAIGLDDAAPRSRLKEQVSGSRAYPALVNLQPTGHGCFLWYDRAYAPLVTNGPPNTPLRIWAHFGTAEGSCVELTSYFLRPGESELRFDAAGSWNADESRLLDFNDFEYETLALRSTLGFTLVFAYPGRRAAHTYLVIPPGLLGSLPEPPAGVNPSNPCPIIPL